MIKVFVFFSYCLFVFSCSSLLKYDKRTAEFKSEEFDKKVKIIEFEESEASMDTPELTQDRPQPEATPAPVPESKPKKMTKPKKTKKVQVAVPLKRQPEIEDSEGFDNNRRPLVDPFRVGEKVVHQVSYLGANAGKIAFMVKPFAVVNGRKNYNFFIDIKSSSFFTRVFAVDDQIQTYVDYETLNPGAYKLNIRDSMQVKEARSFFDFESLKADYWEHRYTEKSGHQEKKLNWSILPFSQNPFSAIFYMRVFKWQLDKEYSFRVADDEKNVVFKAKVLEKAKITTEAGEFDAIKLKAEVTARGNFSKATDFYMWISDDDRKYVLRIEVKLPVGSLVSEVIEIKEGN